MKNKKYIDGIVFLFISVMLIVGGTSAIGLSMVNAKQQERAKEIDENDSNVENGVEVGEGLTDERETTNSYKQAIEQDGNFSEIDYGIGNIPLKNYYYNFETGIPVQEKNLNIDEEDARENLDLPENVDVKVYTQEVYRILWNEDVIMFYDYDVQRKKGDMSVLEAVESSKSYIEKIAGTSVTCKRINVYMLENFEKMSGNTNYGSRFYRIDFYMGEKGAYSVFISTVTGKIDSFFYYREKRTDAYGFLTKFYELYEAYNYDVSWEYEIELERVKEMYSKIACDYVQNTLELGEVINTFGLIVGSMSTTDGEERFVMTIYCSLDTGDIVEVIIDEAGSEVCGYEINPNISY